MTRQDLLTLIQKGKITHTGLIRSNGSLAKKFDNKDLDDVANQFITEPGITDGTSEGLQTSQWLEQHGGSSSSSNSGSGSGSGSGSEGGSGEGGSSQPVAGAVVMTITGLENMLDYDTAASFNINIVANDYKGANVTLYATATNAVVKSSKGAALSNDVAWSVKSLKDKNLALKVEPESNCDSYAVNARLVDDQNKVLAELSQEFTVRPKAVDYNTLLRAVEVAPQFDNTVVVFDNIDVQSTVEITEGQNIIIDLNGNTLSNSNDIWLEGTQPGGPKWSILAAVGGELTVKGSGAVRTKANDCYCIDVRDGGKVTVEGDAEYVGNIHALYVYEGHADVKGGHWSVQQKFNATYPDEYTLNLYDANRTAGTATLAVSGGSYVNFNPGDCRAEGEHTNFLAPGYTVTENEGVYTVVAE